MESRQFRFPQGGIDDNDEMAVGETIMHRIGEGLGVAESEETE